MTCCIVVTSRNYFWKSEDKNRVGNNEGTVKRYFLRFLPLLERSTSTLQIWLEQKIVKTAALCNVVWTFKFICVKPEEKFLVLNHCAMEYYIPLEPLKSFSKGETSR